MNIGWWLQAVGGLLAIISALMLFIGFIISPQETIIRSIKNIFQFHSGSGDNVTGDKIVNINTPTVFEVVNRNGQILPDGTYEIKVNLRHIGEMVVPEFGIRVMEGAEYLAYGELPSGGPDYNYPSIDISPTPNVIMRRAGKQGLIIYNLPPRDYIVTILFKEKPPSAPYVKITPLKKQ